MADKELPAAQDVLVEENEQVKALVVLLMGKDPAGGRELEELAGQVASIRRICKGEMPGCPPECPSPFVETYESHAFIPTRHGFNFNLAMARTQAA